MASETADEIDHYAVLGLPSGDEGAALTLKEIEKAYRNESRRRHPDKRPDDPNATADFQKLTFSFDVLKDDDARRAFDAQVRARFDRTLWDLHRSAKRRRAAVDLDERERAASAAAVDPTERKEKKVAADLKRELADFLARNAKERKSNPSRTSASGQMKGDKNEGESLDRERVLKVSWERNAGDYGAVKLRELFEKFGGVEDVVIKSNGSKKKGSAIVVMTCKQAAVAATHSFTGFLSNPLLVLPLHATPNTSNTFPPKSAETINPKLSNIVGSGFQDYEASILNKLEKLKDKK